MISDKHLLGKFEFIITQKGNIHNDSDNSPFGTSLRVNGSTAMYGSNVYSYIRGTYLTFQYAETTIASARSPIPIPRADAYNVEMYDEYPLAGLTSIIINRNASDSTFIDIKGIEEFLKSGRATALSRLEVNYSSLILPVPTEQLINILIDNDISCLFFNVSGTPAGNTFGAVGSVANIAHIPLIENINVQSYCTEFPDLLPASNTLVTLIIGSPNLAGAARMSYLMTGEIGDLRGMWRLTEFHLQYFNGMQHEYYLPVNLLTITLVNIYNDIKLPENWLDLVNLERVSLNNFVSTIQPIYIDHLSNLIALELSGSTNLYVGSDAILSDTIRAFRQRRGNVVNVDMPDMNKPVLHTVIVDRLGYNYISERRAKTVNNLEWIRNNTTTVVLDKIISDFLLDIILGNKVEEGGKRLNISQSFVNNLIQEYPTNNLTEITILNGGNNYVVGDVLTTPTIGTGAIIQVVGGTNPNPSALTNSGATLSIINSGSGYSVNNYLRVKRTDNAGNSGIVRVTSVDTFGGITGLAVISVGGNYNRNLDYDLLSGSQSSVEVTSVDGTGKITSVSILNGGSDFHVDQTVWFGGSGSGSSLRGRTDARRIVQYGYTVTY